MSTQPQATAMSETPKPIPMSEEERNRRERLGFLVRVIWMNWASEQPNPKPSWLIPWIQLAEPDKEVDRRIGEQLYDAGYKQAIIDNRASLDAAREELRQEREKLADEKQRRVYYQDIVYDVCNQLDNCGFEGKTVCGTLNSPSNQVTDRLSTLSKQLADAKEAIKPVLSAAKLFDDDYMSKHFKPGCQCEMILTIAEIRTLHAVVNPTTAEPKKEEP